MGFTIPKTIEQRCREHLTFLYGETQAPALMERLRSMLAQFHQRKPELLELLVAPVGERPVVALGVGPESGQQLLDEKDV